MKTTHKEKLRISRGMKGGFGGEEWQVRKDAIAEGLRNKALKIKKAKEAKA